MKAEKFVSIERFFERMLRLEHGANVLPLMHVCGYYVLFVMLIAGIPTPPIFQALIWLIMLLANYSLTIGVLHMHAHRPLFVAPAPNRLVELLLCFPSLLSASEMRVFHVYLHHKHANGPTDPSTTIGHERGWRAIAYWLRYSFLVKWVTARELYKTDSRPAFRTDRLKMPVDLCLCLSAAVTITWIAPLPALLVWWVPMVITWLTSGYFSWLTHAPASALGQPTGSLNTVSNLLMVAICNQGAHDTHHRHPGIHWTDLPDKIGHLEQYDPRLIAPYWVTLNTCWRILTPMRFYDAKWGTEWQARLAYAHRIGQYRLRWLPYFAWIPKLPKKERPPARPRTLFASLFGLVVYAAAGLTVPYFLMFAGGVLVPKTVDSPDPGSSTSSLVWNVLLIAAFGIQHSWMARAGFKTWLRAKIHPALERSVYVLASCVALGALMWLWRPITTVVFDVTDTWAEPILRCVWGLGGLVVYAAAFQMDHLHLLGVRQAFRGAVDDTPPTLHTAGLHRLVRHPLMTGLLLVCWATPLMTLGHLLFAAAMTLYILVGTRLEERTLTERLGDDYNMYRSQTPRFFPTLRKRRAPPPWRADNPTHDIRPRRVHIDFCTDPDPHPSPFWYAGSPFKTHLHNAASLFFPSVEVLMAEAVRQALSAVSDPVLRKDMVGFNAQEVTHGVQHRRSADLISAAGYDAHRLVRFYDWVAARLLKPMFKVIGLGSLSHPFVLAQFAWVEHMTAVLAEKVLRDDLEPQSSHPMKRLFYWHGAEELEHKNVVFNVYSYVSGNYVGRIAAVATASLVMVLLLGIGTLALLAQVPAVHKLKPTSTLGFMVHVVRDAASYFFVKERMAIVWIQKLGAYLKPSFHPSQYDTRDLETIGLAALQNEDWRVPPPKKEKGETNDSQFST